jgi:hypothetical protein
MSTCAPQNGLPTTGGSTSKKYDLAVRLGRHKFTMCPGEIIICQYCGKEQQVLHCRQGTDGLLPPCPEAPEQYQGNLYSYYLRISLIDVYFFFLVFTLLLARRSLRIRK